MPQTAFTRRTALRGLMIGAAAADRACRHQLRICRRGQPPLAVGGG